LGLLPHPSIRIHIRIVEYCIGHPIIEFELRAPTPNNGPRIPIDKGHGTIEYITKKMLTNLNKNSFTDTTVIIATVGYHTKKGTIIKVKGARK
jgi:hypothetical protein